MSPSLSKILPDDSKLKKLYASIDERVYLPAITGGFCFFHSRHFCINHLLGEWVRLFTTVASSNCFE